MEGARLIAVHQNRLNYRLHIVEYLSCGNADYAKALAAQEGISARVAMRLIVMTVRFSDDFDDQAGLKAGEVGCQTADRKLTAKP